PGEIHIEEARHVHPLLVHEQPERRADAWVGIEQLVEAVARIVPETDVEHPLVAQGPHEGDREPRDFRVVRAHAQAGGAALRRVLAQLATRKAGDALGPLVEDAVEHPDGRVVNEWSEIGEHTSELQSLAYLVCRLLLEKK